MVLYRRGSKSKWLEKSKELNKLYEIKTLLDDTAKDLAQLLPDAAEWRGWVVYLLQALEAAAMDIDQEHPEQYERMLGELVEDISFAA